MPSKQSAINSLSREKWTLVDAQQHPLGSLQGKDLDSYRLIVLLGSKNKIGASYFQLFLRNASGKVSAQPVVVGLHNQGKYPSYNWIEIINLLSRVSFGPGKQDVSINGLIQQLFQYLADLIPPGGHMMVEYDSPERQDTARSLILGTPPVATPLGYMLFSAGCGAGFKDWYFAESGTEGPRKLQGYKALNSQHAQLKAKEMVKELIAFLDRIPSGASSELETSARDRAHAILSRLEQHNTS